MGKSQTYATGIKVLFMHPSSLYYVAVCKENNLKILDLPTMSFIGQTTSRLQFGHKILKVIFTPSTNLFYTLTDSLVLSSHMLVRGQKISWTPTQFRMQPEKAEKILEISQITNERDEFVVVSSQGFDICSPEPKITHISFEEPILRALNLSPITQEWVIFTQAFCCIVRIDENGYSVINTFSIKLAEGSQVFLDPYKKLVGCIDHENNICVLNCNQAISSVMRVRREAQKSL